MQQKTDVNRGKARLKTFIMIQEKKIMKFWTKVMAWRWRKPNECKSIWEIKSTGI